GKGTEAVPMELKTKTHRLGAGAFTIAIGAALVLATELAGPTGTSGGELSAVYREGALHVTVPVDEGTAQPRKLQLEILDPSDKPIVRRARTLPAGRGRGSWTVILPVGAAVPVEDLVWDRLRIDIGDRSKIVSISEILRLPVVRLFAQRSYAAGSAASARIITASTRTGRALRGSL